MLSEAVGSETLGWHAVTYRTDAKRASHPNPIGLFYPLGASAGGSEAERARGDLLSPGEQETAPSLAEGRVAARVGRAPVLSSFHLDLI